MLLQLRIILPHFFLVANSENSSEYILPYSVFATCVGPGEHIHKKVRMGQ